MRCPSSRACSSSQLGAVGFYSFQLPSSLPEAATAETTLIQEMRKKNLCISLLFNAVSVASYYLSLESGVSPLAERFRWHFHKLPWSSQTDFQPWKPKLVHGAGCNASPSNRNIKRPVSLPKIQCPSRGQGDLGTSFS